MFRCPVYSMFGFPLRVNTPCLVGKAQLVSVLVASTSSVRLLVASSPVPTIVPATATCPPCGQPFVALNVLLIATGTAAEAAAPLPLTSIENDGLMLKPTSDCPRVPTAT